MSGLLSLSNELILSVASFLKPERPISLAGRPFECWPEILRGKNDEASEQLQHLDMLARTCWRLHGMLTRYLYEYVPLLEDADRTRKLLRTLESNRALCDYIRHISINVATAQSAKEFHEIFFLLPNIHTLDIKAFDAYDVVPWPADDMFHRDDQHCRTSPVRVLRLVECGARKENLYEILTFPRALQELWYDLDQEEWSVDNELDPRINFTCAAVQRAIDEHKQTLEKLVMTRSKFDSDTLGPGDEMDFARFTALKSLCVNYMFLVGSDANLDVWLNLPPTLEELEVFYDGAENVGLIYMIAMRPAWLYGLLKQPLDGNNANKPKYTPELKRLRIISYEWYPDNGNSSEEEGEEKGVTELEISRVRSNSDSPWQPPSYLLRRLLASRLKNLSWSIFLHPQRRCAYVPEGGTGFIDEWEDTWDQ